MAPDTDRPLDRTELPPDFAEHAADVTGLDAPPATLEEWWRAVQAQYDANDVAIGLELLYSETPTRHEVHVDGRVRYANCALDAVQAAVIVGQSPVTVRSIDPVAATPVTITVHEDDVAVSPEGAVLCFGSTIDAADVEAVGSLAEWSVQDDANAVRDAVCQYTNAFESEATYEQWAAATDCVSLAFEPAVVMPMLRALPYDRPQGDDSETARSGPT